MAFNFLSRLDMRSTRGILKAANNRSGNEIRIVVCESSEFLRVQILVFTVETQFRLVHGVKIRHILNGIYWKQNDRF